MKDLVGNKAVAEILGRLFEKGRVPNAMLFAGPDGVGKKQFALALARALVCLSPRGGYCCGDCAACGRVGSFTFPTSEKKDDFEKVFLSQHPDVGMVVPFKRNVLVDAIRALEVEANFRPYEAKARVFIVDDADKMNDAASNALLKTLEEPPATTHIILVTSRSDSLLATIRSRCQMISFSPAPIDEIERHLIASGNFSPEDAAIAARASGGSVGRALEIVPSSYRTQRSLMMNLLRAAATGNTFEMLSSSEAMTDAKNKDDYEETLSVLQGLIRDVWLIGNGAPDTELLNVEIRAELAELASAFTSARLSSWLTEIETMQESFIVNINRKVATDSLVMEMAG